jgi:hypothetical protein
MSSGDVRSSREEGHEHWYDSIVAFQKVEDVTGNSSKWRLIFGNWRVANPRHEATQ